MEIADSKQFGTTNWVVLNQKTSSFTLHAICKPGDKSIAFGIKGILDENLAQEMVNFLDKCDPTVISDSALHIIHHRIGAFDACVFLTGEERRFMRGWTEELVDITHAFPIFLCELDDKGALPSFDIFRRWVDVFDLKRQPEPYFTFKMKGGASKLNVENWRTEKYSTLLSFVNVLSSESNSFLEVVNRHGELLSFCESTGRADANKKIHAHLLGNRV